MGFKYNIAVIYMQMFVVHKDSFLWNFVWYISRQEQETCTKVKERWRMECRVLPRWDDGHCTEKHPRGLHVGSTSCCGRDCRVWHGSW